jgi:hypothetical protein
MSTNNESYQCRAAAALRVAARDAEAAKSREYVAAAALAGLLASTGATRGIEKKAVQIADRLIAVLDESSGGEAI